MSGRSADELREALAAIGARRRPLLADLKETTDEVRALFPEALDAGLTRVEIAKLSGVSRPTLDSFLR